MAGFFKKAMIYLGLSEEDAQKEEKQEGKTVIRENNSFRSRLSDKPKVKKIYEEDGFSERGREQFRAVKPIQSKVHIIEPTSFNDAQLVGDKFKADIPVIINLSSTDHDTAKRLLDFASGLTYGLNGSIQRVAEKVFLITPNNVEVSAEEKIRLQQRGLFNQY
ncbi:MAG: hypothetical protein A3K54_02465 [Omnitrophica WOR_2 bacterium RBG_13_44_8]|nr:MAG: hypothetical protein A3K54_02465 [Omnitrophica WOR_2 bacterium RBG_13_44_8]